MFPKLLFNVCNAGMFMALGLVLYKLAVGRRSQKADWLALALIYAALWEISPVFGQTNLWMCGACNYLWATVGCCALFAALAVLFAAAVCQYGAHGGRHGVGRAAGWLVKREYQRRNAGLFGAGRRCCVQAGAQTARLDGDRPGGALVGFALLITARGNFNRASGFSDYDSLLTRYAMRFFACLNMLKDYACPCCFLCDFVFAALLCPAGCCKS